MKSIKGKWRWNEEIDLSSVTLDMKSGKIPRGFISNGETYYYVYQMNDVHRSPDPRVCDCLIYGHNMHVASLFRDDGRFVWASQKYRIMDFGETEQEISEELYAFIFANATEYSPIAEKLEKIADNVPKVFEAGKQQGHGEEYDSGYDDGHEAGKADERTAFWDTFMPDDLENWRYLFYSPRWNDANFYPTKAIKPKGPASYSFFSHGITNFKQRLIDCEVEFDTSGVTGGNYMFAYGSVLTHLPTISFTGLTESIYNVFDHDQKLVEIEKIILKEDGSTTFSNWFVECHSLETIAFEGVIGQDMDLRWSKKLSEDSITNIINHLFDEAEGKTLTLSKAAVDRAFAHSSLLSDGSSTIIPGTHPDNLYWQPLIAQKIGTADNPKWIINLIG